MDGRRYLVCATQRSGSTLMCRLLAETGVAGNPLEFFEARAATGRPPHPSDYLDGLERTGAGIRDDLEPPQAPDYSSLETVSDYREHLRRTFARGTTPNGVFGAKLMFNQLPELQLLAGGLPEYAGLAVDPLLRALFDAPTYVWVRRNDTVRQAVSMWRALQTRRWDAETPAEERDDVPRYSFAGIDHLVRRFAGEDDGWRAHFAAHGIEPLTVSYEDDLERDPGNAVRTVLAALSLDAPAGWAVPETLSRQADGLSEQWVQAYHRDRAAAEPQALTASERAASQ